MQCIAVKLKHNIVLELRYKVVHKQGSPFDISAAKNSLTRRFIFCYNSVKNSLLSCKGAQQGRGKGRAVR